MKRLYSWLMITYARCTGITISSLARINPFIQFGENKNIYILGRVYINRYCSILAGKGSTITINNNVLIGPGVVITAANHSTKKEHSLFDQIREEANVEIGEEVRIGANAVILPGVNIAKGVIVGAGAIVTKSIEDEYSIYAGVPAKKIGERE